MKVLIMFKTHNIQMKKVNHVIDEMTNNALISLLICLSFNLLDCNTDQFT